MLIIDIKLNVIINALYYYRFDALVRDVFPNIEFKDIEYETLAEAIRNVCKETNLVANEMQVYILYFCIFKNKDIRLYFSPNSQFALVYIIL
jgi:hypothetical protein